MPNALPTVIDMASKAKKWNPGGQRGKLHRELNVPEDQKIPAAKLDAATHSSNPEVRRDAIRAKTMKGWKHTGPKTTKPKDHLTALYGEKGK